MNIVYYILYIYTYWYSIKLINYSHTMSHTVDFFGLHLSMFFPPFFSKERMRVCCKSDKQLQKPWELRNFRWWSWWNVWVQIAWWHLWEIQNVWVRKVSRHRKKNIPIGSMYGIFTYIYHKNKPNAGKYTIHGSYGIWSLQHGFQPVGNVRKINRDNCAPARPLGAAKWYPEMI